MRYRAALLPCVLVLACSPDTPTAPEDDQLAHAPEFASVIEDARNGGNPHFYFLPPMVSQPTFSGTADGSVAPVVQVCEWQAASLSCGALVAAFGPTGETEATTVRYDAASETWMVNWHTDRCLEGACTLDLTKTYRLRVLVGAVELGHADLRFVSKGSQLKNVETGEYIGLVDGRTLPVKFRIETGAVTVVGEGAPASIGAAGGVMTTPEGELGLVVPAGALGGATGLSVTPVTSEVAALGPWSKVYDLGPDGTSFAKPVVLTLRFAPESLPAGVPPEALAVVTWDGSGWQAVDGSAVSVTDNTVSASITHFSVYSVAIRPNQINGAPTPTAITVGSQTTLSGTAVVYQTVQQPYCYYTSGWFPSQVCTTYPQTYVYPAVGYPVQWSSSVPAVATVPAGPTYTNAIGQVTSPPITGVSPGTTQIRATSYYGVSNLVTITVTAASTVVTTTADAGAGSLRQILADAPAGSTITFATSLLDAGTPGGSCSTTALPGCAIELAAPLVIAKNVTIVGGEDTRYVRLDGGHTTGTTGVQVLRINSGTVTLRRLTITRGRAPSQGGGAFVQAGTVTFDECSFLYNKATSGGGGLGQGGALYNAGGNVTLTATTVAHDTAEAGAALYNYNFGTLHVVGGSVTNNVSTNIGGGLLNFGAVTVENTLFSGNTATNHGGGIYNYAAQLGLSGTTLQHNSANVGGALYNWGIGQVTVSGGGVTGNTAVTNAGAIYSEGALTLTGTQVTANRANNKGGALFIQNGTATLGGSTVVRGNRATGLNGGLGQGGGAFVGDGLLVTTATTFAFDTADAGAALYNYNGTMRLNAGTVVNDNRATNIGGGLLNFSGVAATGATFSRNTATNQGGAIFTYAVASTSLTNSAITGNRSAFGGGLYDYTNAIVTLVGTRVAEDTASSYGAGIYNDGNLTIRDGSTVELNVAAYYGGGIYASSGTINIDHSTISQNRAQAGGGAGISNSGTLTVTNSSITGNTAPGTSYGGGVANGGTVNLTRALISGNSAGVGGGIHNDGSLTLVSESSVCGNTASNPPPNISGGPYTGTNFDTVGSSAPCPEP
jgi:predicted outer membrane repeat protein